MSSYLALRLGYIYIYIYIYTRFQKGFHIERYIDRYIVLFCCTCARAHFSLLIVQLVKKLGSTINSLFFRFFVPVSQYHIYPRYPRKYFTQIYRALCGDAMLELIRMSSNMADRNQQKHLLPSFDTKL